MRALPVLLCALLVACGKPATSTPPLYATLPASDADKERGPQTRLPEDTHPLRYAVSLELIPERDTYRGEVTIELALDRPRETLWLHQKGARAESIRVVRVGAEPVPGHFESVSETGLTAVRLGQPVGPGMLRLEIKFEADVGKRLDGIYRAQAGGVPYLFTQFEAISARNAFPCFDEPRFKTPFDITLRVKREHVAISNTHEVSSDPIADGLREVRFATTEKLPTYLIAFAVGPFDVVDAPPLAPNAFRPRELPLRGIAVKGRGAELAHALRETPLLVDRLEQYFAMSYPYDKLDLIAVPDFAAGAMENAGAITFRDTLLLIAPDASEGQRRSLSYVNAHELAHQWFGNLVTMPWWDDIWLNEAFATWMGTRVVSEVHPEYHAELGALAAAQGAMYVDSQAAARQIRQPVDSDADISGAFDSITYSKGGAVLGMFERFVGADTFRAGLRLYMNRHRFGSATASDLIAALAEASGRPELRPAFASFLEQPGVPLVETQLACSQGVARMSLKQSRYLPLGSQAPRTGPWQVPVCVRFGTLTAPREQCLLASAVETQIDLQTDSCPSWLMPNAQAQGYYRWALPPAERKALLGVAAQLSSAEQVSLAANLMAAMRSGTLAADEGLAALTSLLNLPERMVLETVLGALSGVERDLVDEATLPIYRAVLGNLLRPRFQELGLYAAPGEDAERMLKRVAVVRALALTVRDPELNAELAALARADLGLATHPKLAQLAPDLRDEALAVAVRTDGAAFFEKALARFFASDDSQERSRLLWAMAATEDPALSERVLGLALDPRLRTNERGVPLASQAAQRATRGRAYDWLKQNLDAYFTQLGVNGRPHVFDLLGNYCDAQTLADARAFFGPKVAEIPGAARHFALAMESVELCQAFVAAQGASARSYFWSAGAGKSPAH